MLKQEKIKVTLTIYFGHFQVNNLFTLNHEVFREQVRNKISYIKVAILQQWGIFLLSKIERFCKIKSSKKVLLDYKIYFLAIERVVKELFLINELY